MLNGKKIIALCMAKAGDNRHFEFISSLNRNLQENGYKLFIYHTCSDFYRQKQSEEGEKAVFELMDYDIIDAVVLFCESFWDKELLKQLIETAQRHDTPVISVGEIHENATSVVFDYESGFEAVIRHVIEYHGVKDTCMIAGAKGEYHSENRINVYKKVLAEHQLPFSEKQVYYGDFWWGPTRDAVQKMIEEKTLPKAILCANDGMAIAACEELKKQGYLVPEQVLVTGFDGTESALIHEPPITTAKCDMDLATKEITEILNCLGEGKETASVHEVPYVADIYHTCGCKTKTGHGINIGERMKWAEDRFYKYQDDERTLMEVSEQILGCESPSQFAECLKEFKFYNACFVVNSDCLDETVNPASSERAFAYDEIMQVVYRTDAEGVAFPEAMPKKNLLPDLESRMMYREDPLLFTAMTFLGKAFGYMYFGSVQPEEYAKILQYVKTLGNAFGTYRIVKNLKYTADSMERMSQQDFLTGVLNRTGFYAALPSLLEKANGKYVMVASLDVDNLKKVNDLYGHSAGDFVIKKVAEAMEALPFDDKLCGRFGGDEMVLCAVADTVAEEKLLQERIEEYLNKENAKSNRPYEAAASIGVVTVKVEAFDMTSALKRSDQLMYENKARKKAGRR